MRKPILSRYQVDKVPIIIRPQFYLYGYGLGLFLFLYLLFLRLTTKVKISGREKLRENANHIFCFWHNSGFLAFTSVTPLIPSVLDRSQQAWMQHPSWYMKPIHILL
jgi:1-acyl-sn-glycerol-3-phosphate acyltransferase